MNQPNVTHFKSYDDLPGDVFCLNCSSPLYLDHDETLVRPTDISGEVLDLDIFICRDCHHASVFFDRRPAEDHEVIANHSWQTPSSAIIYEIRARANHAAQQGADAPDGSIYISDSGGSIFLPDAEMRYQLTPAGRAYLEALNRDGAA